MSTHCCATRWRRYKARLTPKDIRCVSSLPQTPIVVEVDPVRITQVITNLLTNAVKYTPVGGLIHLRVGIQGQFLVISVRDNGVGAHDRCHASGL